MKAFTTRYETKALRLINRVIVRYHEHALAVLAQWDTGADRTCISEELASALSLEPDGTIDVITPSGTAKMPTYTIDVILPDNIVMEGVCVAGSKIGRGNVHALIGMDIISLGDFATSCKDGVTMFTFRMPSVEDADYTDRR